MPTKSSPAAAPPASPVSFNLVDRPWIPVLVPGQVAPQLFSLRDTLVQAHVLTGLWGDSPLENAALYRLLLAVLHRGFGPADPAAWGQLWAAGHFPPAPLTAYLQQWQGRFDLFAAEHPFFQAQGPGRTISALHLVFSQGRSATLFQHYTEDPGIALTPPQAARQLLAVQQFGLGGLSGIPHQNLTDSPSARGIVFLAQGDTLFETLMLNLLPYPDDTVFPSTSQDAPRWEQDDPFRPPRDVPHGYLDYLTWPARRVLLFPDGAGDHVTVRTITRSAGLSLDAAVRNPQHHYRQGRQRVYALRYDRERSVWRDSMALYHLDPAAQDSSATVQPPAACAWLARLVAAGYIPPERTLRWRAMGLASAKAKVLFVREETVPLPLAYLADAQRAAQLGAAMQLATSVSTAVWQAARVMATLLTTPGADPTAIPPASEMAVRLQAGWNTEQTYWTALEQDWALLVNDLAVSAADTALPAWGNAVRHAALQTLAALQAHLGESPRVLKAYAAAVALLRGRLYRLLNPSPPTATDSEEDQP